MGLLSLGTPLHWNESKEYADHVRQHAISQLLNSYKCAQFRENDIFYWGDEIEYMMVYLDSKNKETRLAIEEDGALTRLSEDGESYEKAVSNKVLFHPEYGRFMLEATPLDPYNGNSLSDYLSVEDNMTKRRILAKEEISNANVVPLTLTTYPMMGVGDFCFPSAKVNGSSSKSLFLPDDIINKHVRFPTLTANIRRRRGSKVAINIPLFKDEHTRDLNEIDPTIPIRQLFPFSDGEALAKTNPAAKPGHIYMDAMGFGMGSSCLQVTMQAKDIFEARYLYDSLINIAPLMLAITAAAPVFRGQLADQDVRWNVIAGAVDDRTPFERDSDPIPNHSKFGGHNNVNVQSKMIKIPKSRYDSVDQYLGDLIPNSSNKFNFFKDEYNDINPPINESIKNELINKGMDKQLANHFGHLFIRDPLVIFSERINQDDSDSMDHFENIQSTNWQTLRFKIPSQNSGPGTLTPGWRVELRPMEIQLTDFENAAFSVFSILLARAILKNKQNWYLPISKVELNMKRAHSRDAINREKFWWKNVANGSIVEFTLDEIFNGSKANQWIGLVQMVKNYVKETWFSDEVSLLNGKLTSFNRLEAYFDLVSKRASGELPTTATFFRDLIKSHPNYKKDSMISQEIAFEMCEFARKLSDGDAETLGQFFGELANEIKKF
ncbi:glutamate--cysteine ligase [Martiniozyma asiatica (nom. inval.)]|nr:glutamate--cysteine ligase [Martiniozyma asiatica]